MHAYMLNQVALFCPYRFGFLVLSLILPALMRNRHALSSTTQAQRMRNQDNTPQEVNCMNECLRLQYIVQLYDVTVALRVYVSSSLRPEGSYCAV